MAKPTQLPENQRSALDCLKPLSEQLGLYLAGGTALAFHLGHRLSEDLDLFSLEPDLDLNKVSARATSLSGIEVVSLTDVAFTFRAVGVPVDVVRYPFPLLNAPSPGPQSIATASVEDLVTMKLSAVARRGLRRDFWDLDEIFQRGGLTLESALESYVRRFGVRESDVYPVLRSLTYFDDAERETVMPNGLTPDMWDHIKLGMTRRVVRALKALG